MSTQTKSREEVLKDVRRSLVYILNHNSSCGIFEGFPTLYESMERFEETVQPAEAIGLFESWKQLLSKYRQYNEGPAGQLPDDGAVWQLAASMLREVDELQSRWGRTTFGFG